MKGTKIKPLVTISTYEERQEELNKTTVMRDEVDRAAAVNGYTKTESIINFPTPPPPPQFANAPINSPIFNNEIKPSQLKQRIPPPQSPTPDYDSTPSHTLPKCTNLYNGSMQGTIGRVAASEIAKANGDIAELESIESYQLQNPSSPIPKPPSVYFNPQSSGPPTMKKTTRPVSVTIGEYGGQNFRKEPSKLDFIKSNLENGNHQQHNQLPKDDNVSEMLRSELERTLSRSNLKKKNEAIQLNGHSNLSNGSFTNGKPILQKTQSSNIEKIANMLQAKHNQSELNNNRSATLTSSNRVTISLPNKIELRKTESTPPPTTTTPIQTNGILKNGYTKSNFTEKSITFGN